MSFKNIPKEFAPAPRGITLYSLGTSNGVKISIALSLLNLPYTLHIIDISKNIQKEPWFVEINPNGRIPAILDIDESGNVTNVWESAAILLYLVDKYDKKHKISFPRGSPEYLESLEWLIFQVAGVGPMQGQAGHFKFYAPEQIPYGVKRYTEETRRLYSVLEKQLTDNGSGFLVGDHISIADVATVGWVSVSYSLGIDLAKEFPAVHDWVQRVIDTPGVYEGFNAHGTWRGFTQGPWKAPQTPTLSDQK
ncbi:uncharacterized protein SAPINGB_P000809 [Magnusiomyces paraingens]|uniref:Glutathione S-transferase n=1 Tax=Magnusiomyces paraingens TaxID=2606893 RepID=A0A5E8B454_9ASCO|nr:uncharacterized protein SAPINGB_P000809 [Saprochaete ingens]VVT45601.1 unnamed protein product [Saprochaete ingens]